jgi:metal transporter CNNM
MSARRARWRVEHRHEAQRDAAGLQLRGGSYGGGRPTVTAGTLSLVKLLLLPVVSAAPIGAWSSGIWIREEEHHVEDGSLWVYLSVAVALVLLGGAFAGLTIALMGQDETYLHVLMESGETERERKNADAVMRLLKKGKHWVLVTLLLSNVITNETLPIVLDRSLGGGWPAVLSSTALIGR